MGRAGAGGEIKWRRMDQGSAVPIGSCIEPVDLLTVLSDVMGLARIAPSAKDSCANALSLDRNDR